MKWISGYRRGGGWLPALIALAALCGCWGEAPDGVVDACSDTLELPPGVSTDILFVIDNSASMWEEQQKIADELEAFVTALASGPIKNDFQVGVITTGVTYNRMSCEPDDPPELAVFPQQSGRLQQGKTIDGSIVDAGSARILSHDDPQLVEKFAELVRQGVQGPGQEMGLEAARRAVTHPLVNTPIDGAPPGNQGLLRPGSRLLIVIVTDEDDCSDPSATAVALESICGGPCTAHGECDDGYFCLLDFYGLQRCQRNSCETSESRALLEPVQTYVDVFSTLDDGTQRGRTRETFLAVIGPQDPSDPTIPQRCESGGTIAYGAGVRYLETVEAMGDQGFIDSICRDNYAATLEKIAELVGAPQILTLDNGPPDGQLMRILIDRPGGETLTCLYGEGFSYEPATDFPAQATMMGPCRLQNGDAVHIELFCAN